MLHQAYWTVLLLIHCTAAPGQERQQAIAPPPAVSQPETWTEQRMQSFLRDLEDALFERHVVRDPQRPTFGMTYEFWRDGKQYQDFGLDSLHDGAWLVNAMMSAHRCDPTGQHLARLQHYQLAFYLNALLNSDRLFPEIRKTDEDKAPLEKAWRGRLPLAWDDGRGFDLNSGKPHRPGYNTNQGPNHLIQDVADALLSVWVNTRDQQVADALQLIQQERVANFGTIPVVAYAAATARNGPLKPSLPRLSPTAMPGYAGLYQQNGEPLASYEDGLGWQYGQAMAYAALTGNFDRDFLAYAAARCLGHALMMELYYDDRPWPPGLHFFDIQEPPRFVAQRGRLNDYGSQGKKLMGGRGIQIAWVAAGILPELRRHSECWEAYHQAHHASEPLVRFVDAAPTIDGNRDSLYDPSATIQGGGTRIHLMSGTKALYILLESADPEVSFSMRHAGPVNGKAFNGYFRLAAGGGCVITNDAGEVLTCEKAYRGGDSWRTELAVPYTVVPEQKQWINGVENGRYIVELGGTQPQTVYMLSRPDRVVRKLEAYVDGTIRTWHEVWNELGVVPSGYRGTHLRNAHWELSDAGNYAHLIRLLALRLIDLDGKTEWEIARAHAKESRWN